jgi:hypothetical protein
MEVRNLNLINKIMRIIILSLIILHFVFVIIMRNSYTHILEDEKKFNEIKETYTSETIFNMKGIILNEDSEDGNFGNVESEEEELAGKKTYDFNLLFDKSEVVVEVSKLKETQQKNCTLSEVKIEKIYKGKELIKFETLKVYEMYFLHLTYKRFECPTGNTPMVIGDKYIIFLNRKFKDNEYRTDEENNLFTLTTYDVFSKYIINKDLKFFEYDKPYTINDILGYDAVIDSSNKTSKRLVNEYTKVHKEVLKKCGIN